MKNLSKNELNQVAGGFCSYGQNSVPLSVLQGLQIEATSDARKAAILVGTITAVIGYSVALPFSLAASGTVALSAAAYSYEYSNTYKTVLNMYGYGSEG